MKMLNKDFILEEIPLFANLSIDEHKIIRHRCSIKEYKRGEIIYREGSPKDAFYCVISGRVIVYTQDKQGKQTVLEYLHRGKYFGIISLLTGEPHSVTTEAMNDCLLLVIKKEDFDFALKKIPRLAIDLSKTLSRRLKNKDLHQKIIFESTLISVFSSYSAAGRTVYALNLGLSIHKEAHKSIIILDICPKDKTHSLPVKLDIKGDYRAFDLSISSATSEIKNFIMTDKFGIDLLLLCFETKPEDDACIKTLVDILSRLVNDYHYIILDLPSRMDQTVFEILNQSDLIHILTGTAVLDLKRTHHLMKRLRSDFRFPAEKMKVIINEYRISNLSPQQQSELLGHPIFATLPKIEFGASDRLILDSPDCEYAKAIRRIARQLGDCSVGLALGVGMAYGFCHIGVLKVIEEEKIPIDVITGSSVGALIAGLWATGKSSQEILEIARDFRDPKYVWNMVDLTFPWIGFIKGKRLYNFLKKCFGDKTFHDVKLPLKIIASDIRRKKSEVLEEGLLIDAIMASCSMPGVFRPFKSKEEMLLDGGIINPLPTEVLLKTGVKKIIAVNVTPSREDILRHYQRMKEQTQPAETLPQRKWFSLKRYLKNKFKLNILEIIFSSIEMMQSEMAEKEAQLADIVLHPDTQGLSWLDLHRAREFARRGEEETRRNLERIKQMINE